MRRRAFLPLAGLISSLAACSDAAPATAPSAAPSPSATTSAAAEPVTTHPGASEWKNAAEVEVQGAKEAGCVARSVREWLRFECRGTGDAAPTGSETEKGFVQWQPGPEQLELTFPVRKGTETRVVIEWGKTSRRLEADWPEGEATRPAIWGRLSPPFPTPPGPCDALALKGRGTFGQPCLLESPSPVTVSWVGSSWEVDNGTESPLESINTVVYGYDAKGNQVDPDADRSSGKFGGSTGWSGNAIAPKGKGARKIDIGDATAPSLETIELGVCGYALTLGGKLVHFQVADGCTDARPRAGHGKPAH